MIDEHYANPKLAAVFDLDNGWSEDRDFYLSLAPATPIDILDLGCGTGVLCDAYAARGHRVTGADPAPPMLEIARTKPNGKDIEWVCATAQEFRSEKRFDLIIMTGHAFQVLLTDEDVSATFETMRVHLNPEGRVVFETRNPAINWVETWNHDINTSPASSESRRFVALSPNGKEMTFEIFYHLKKETLSSRSTLRFMSHTEIKQALQAAGLQVAGLCGDWQGTAFNEHTSLEMIFKARLSSKT